MKGKIRDSIINSFFSSSERRLIYMFKKNCNYKMKFLLIVVNVY